MECTLVGVCVRWPLAIWSFWDACFFYFRLFPLVCQKMFFFVFTRFSTNCSTNSSGRKCTNELNANNQPKWFTGMLVRFRIKTIHRMVYDFLRAENRQEGKARLFCDDENICMRRRLNWPAVAKQIKSWLSDVKVACSSSPTADQFAHLTAFCWPRPPA